MDYVLTTMDVVKLCVIGFQLLGLGVCIGIYIGIKL